MLNDRKLITISAESRALIRAAIRRNPGWPAYRDAHDIDLSEMTTRDAIFDACDELHIDIAAVVAAGPQDPPEPAPKAPRQPKAAARLFDNPFEQDEPRHAPTHVTPAPAAPQVPQEAAQQLLGMIAALAPKAAVDMEQVRDVVANAICIENDRTERRLDELRASVAAIVAEAVQNGPAIRIELKKHDAPDFRKLDGHHHPKFATLLKAAAARQGDGYAPNVWIAGPAGSGKTHAAKMLAKALELPWHYTGALSMAFELLGFIDAAGTYHQTPFREAYEHGGVYLFDETDGSDKSALLALNAALANGTATFPDGQVARHADCIIIATGNTWGLGATAEYVGRSKIDAAFLSRFPVRIAWDYDETLERNISGNIAFAARVQTARAKARAAGLKVLIDPRASIAGAALIAQGFSEQDAADLTYLANLTPEQRKIIGG